MSAIKDGEMFVALLCFMGDGCLNALRKAKMSKSPDACCPSFLKAEKKLASSNLYIKHSIFRVTIKLRTLPFLQSFRSFNVIENLAVTRNRRPRQRLLFAVQQFFPWTALTQRRLHRESTSMYCTSSLNSYSGLFDCNIYLLFWNVKYIFRARHLVGKNKTELAFEHNQGSAPLNSGSSLSNCLRQDPPSHVQLPCLQN